MCPYVMSSETYMDSFHKDYVLLYFVSYIINVGGDKDIFQPCSFSVGIV